MKVNVVSVNHTQYYSFQGDDKTYIKDVCAVYAYDPEQSVHLCELTPSYEIRYLYTYLVLEGEVSEDKRGELDERYCHEDNEDTYMWCSNVKKLTSKECGEFEDMDAACEHLRANWPI